MIYKNYMKNIFTILLFVGLASAQVAPTWVTSSYLQAGRKKVIDGDACNCKTGNTSTPTATIPFPTSFSSVPNLGYGISGYEGDDYLGPQNFQVNRTGLTTSSFSVLVQINGFTHLWILQVTFIGISKTFPHHLNSFDNVPINYTNGALVNISTNSSIIRTYQNTVNYTTQSVSIGSIFNRFSIPLTNNKILIFMTSMFLTGTLETSNPSINNSIDLRIMATVISTQTYKLFVQLSPKCYISKLHFSMIVFDQDDVQASGQYTLVYERIEFSNLGGLYFFPQQFLSNFIIGFTEFTSARCLNTIAFKINYGIVSGSFGLQMPSSSNRAGKPPIIRFNFTVFYIKTWICPNNTIFDPSNNVCVACPLNGCQTCFNLATCSICIQNNQYLLNQLNGQCQLCNISLPGCTTCSNSTFCLDCDQTSNYILIPNNTCSLCNATEFANPINQTCDIQNPNCSVKNCITCQNSNSSICQICKPGFQVVNDICECPNNTIFDPSNNVCVACPLNGCQTCFNLATCSICIQNNQYLLNQLNGQCQLCNISLPGCTTCSNSTFCLDCDQTSNYILIPNNTCSLCNATEFANPINQTCDRQNLTCNVINCAFCQTTDSHICLSCLPGFSFIDGFCQSKCGDFIKTYNQQCDDGNSQFADGCSSLCSIQNDFICQSKNNSLGSFCYFIGEIKIEVIYIDKVDYLNKVEILIEYFPKGLTSWDYFDFISIIEIQSLIPISNIAVTKNKNGTVLLQFQYESDIHGETINISLNPSKSNLDSLSKAPSSLYQIVINPDDNQSANFYESSVYDRAKLISILSLVISGVSLFFFIIGLISGKMIGVQMMAVIQISFFSLISLPQMNPCFAALASLKLVNGYNYIGGNHLENIFTTNQVKGISLFSRFVENFNFTFVLIILPLIICLFSLIIWKAFFRDSLRGKKIFQRSLGQYTLNGLVFSGYIIAVSFILQIMFGNQNNTNGLIGIISLPFSIICLTLIVFYFFFQIFKPQLFGEFTKSFVDDKISSKYYCFMLIERLLIGSCLVFMQQVNVQLILPILVFVFLSIYVMMRRPYKEIKHNIRVVANMIISSIILAIYLSYRLTTIQKRKSKQVFLILPIVVVILLIICVVYNGGAMVYSFYKWLKSRHQKWSEQKPQNELQKNERRQIVSADFPLKDNTIQTQQDELKNQQLPHQNLMIQNSKRMFKIDLQKLKKQIKGEFQHKNDQNNLAQLKFKENKLAFTAKEYDEI